VFFAARRRILNTCKELRPDFIFEAIFHNPYAILNESRKIASRLQTGRNYWQSQAMGNVNRLCYSIFINKPSMEVIHRIGRKGRRPMQKRRFTLKALQNNCVSHRGEGRCAALLISRCLGEGCAFRKTQSDLEEERERAFARLRTLDEAKQRTIATVYHGGKMIWMKAGECHG
jgi:hypothetical protein